VHALGPATLLLAAGVEDGHAVTWPLIAAAFAAQVVFDSLCATVRESALHRIDPEFQLPVILRLAAFDGALIPLGVLVGAAVDDMPLAPLCLLPLLAVLAYAVRDRTARRTGRTTVEALGGGRAPATAAPAALDNRTGLVDRGRFRELLRGALERHRESGAGVSLILFDVDHFADVNDAFGHDTGDDVLRAVADGLRAECRSTDEPARYGADELAVVLPGVSLDEARRLAERVRGRIAELDATAPDGWPLRITVSAGAAALDGRVAGAGQLMAAAQRALHRAKARGRNRVEVHSGTRCDAEGADGRCSPAWAPGAAPGRSVTTDA
jgi:diguanylate cyclase (GGDEF)-like protein